MSPSDLPVEVALDKATGARRPEADELLALFREVSGLEPVVWAGRIVGFGEVEYHQPGGASGRMPELAFASGRSQHTIYLPEGFADRWGDLLDALGPHRSSVVCLYLPRLAPIDRDVLRQVLVRALDETRAGG